MTIRPAALADLPRLVALTRRFIAESSYAAVLPDVPEAVTALLTHLVTHPAAVVLVADAGGAHGVIGLLGLACTTGLYSGQREVVEAVWYVAPEARGAGVALLTAGERWAAEQGAEAIQLIAPVSPAGDRVGRLYARRGYRPVETAYRAPVTPAMTALTVIDDVLPDFPRYVAASRAQPFGDLAGAGLVFHGMAPPPDDTLPAAIAARWPMLTPTLSLLRQSPAGQAEPHLIHTDCDMGDWTAIAYLTEAPPPGDGTTFWRQRATGVIASDAPLVADAAWDDLDQWVPWTTVPAKANRLVLFPSGYYHSRALPANYGEGETARLIQVTFGTGAVPPAGGHTWAS